MYMQYTQYWNTIYIVESSFDFNRLYHWESSPTRKRECTRCCLFVCRDSLARIRLIDLFAKYSASRCVCTRIGTHYPSSTTRTSAAYVFFGKSISASKPYEHTNKPFVGTKNSKNHIRVFKARGIGGTLLAEKKYAEPSTVPRKTRRPFRNQ